MIQLYSFCGLKKELRNKEVINLPVYRNNILIKIYDSFCLFSDIEKKIMEEENFLLVIPNIIPKDHNFRITIVVCE